MCVCVCVCVCAYLAFHTSGSISWKTRKFDDILIYIYIYIYIYMCVCVCVCVCVCYENAIALNNKCSDCMCS